MRRIALSLIAMVALFACNRPASITINFDGLENPLVTFQYELNDSTRIDSVMVENGSLHKEIAVVEMTKIGIYPKQYLINGSMVGADLNLYVEPNDKITLNVECKDGYMIVDVEGSDLYKEYYSVINQCAPYKAERYKLDLRSMEAMNNQDIKTWNELSIKASEAEKKAFTITKEYATANPSSEVNVLLFDWLSIFTYKTEIYEIMDKSLFKGAYKELEEWYLKTLKTFEERRAKALAEAEARHQESEGKGVGDMAPDFTLKNTKGKSVSLKSLRGKWVVLDFWATWCGPCKVSMPHLKEYYEKYAGKFEVVGIVGSSKEEDWKVVVNDFKLPWINVINPQDAPEADDVLKLYNISAFPTYIIIDKEGKIYKKFIGAKQELYDELDKILE
ncbi:MAG: AhpC/TSA family protein [Alistipes sp.]|nr:AhpC/TSA family protein [Alistipes sp.]